LFGPASREPFIINIMSTTKVASLKQNWNAKTPSVKRILQEVKELTKQVEDLLKERGEAEASGSTSGGEGPATSSGKDASSDGVVVVAEALEENIFEWHFAIGGQVGSEFEGGIYHGRILLPPEYPFKPPVSSSLGSEVPSISTLAF